MTKQAGFVLYRRYKKMFDKLTVEQRGELITAIFDYFCEGERKTLSDAATEMAFLFISEQLDYDCSEYEKKCKQNAENAAKRWARREAGTMRSHTDASHRTESQCDADAKPCEAMPTNTNTESESKTNPISISESESGSESKSNTECESVEPPPHPDALTRGETDSPPPPDIKEEKNLIFISSK